MKRLLLTVITLVSLLPLCGAPIEADLGEGLRYHRAHTLPGELPAPGSRPCALVLDLRYATADAGAATALEGWITARASADTPVTVLVNEGTAPVLHGVLAAHQARPGVVTIGIANAGHPPDIVVATTPETERRAYDGFENNGPIAALLTENTDKLRNDEASMMRERAHPAEPLLDEGLDELPSGSSSNEPAATPPPPLDVTLQRAVHLHRALRALKRIP